ncbi:hypothetical protein PTTG_26705 [Puccinia triticina 1-1 BBBD Race 1]|uniref:COesterase domain-containing protein n=1 Tax=Puccinia triticina (isolate 1-1 / race 1 (BBBD)) TaxID=630390 RepID=A0A180GRB0_PUCT1|nr:hypothetical protein PTTG_26705 [Puccinia triticina 1-1 BBBD Race 1]
MFFIFPGGFNFGVSWELTPKLLVKNSMDMGLPIIHVTANHRLNAFGFLGGKEVAEAGVGNLGLKDQRLAMEWIYKGSETARYSPAVVSALTCRYPGLQSRYIAIILTNLRDTVRRWCQLSRVGTRVSNLGEEREESPGR